MPCVEPQKLSQNYSTSIVPQNVGPVLKGRSTREKRRFEDRHVQLTKRTESWTGTTVPQQSSPRAYLDVETFQLENYIHRILGMCVMKRFVSGILRGVRRKRGMKCKDTAVVRTRRRTSPIHRPPLQ